MTYTAEELGPSATESDVEQKILFPLLRDGLGFNSSEIKTKDYLAPTDIDKGAGKKLGYYPDYLVYLAGIPVLAVEAKDPSTDVATGYREARLYATEVNKLYPEGLNPLGHVISCNGTDVLVGPWDSEVDSIRFVVEELGEGTQVLQRLRESIGKTPLDREAKKFRAALTPASWHKPLRLLGGPARQHQTIPPNTFSAELAPLLRKYFDPDETAHSKEVIEKGYCSSQEITKYNATLESLLKDKIPNQHSFSSINTTKNRAESVDVALKAALEQQRDIPDPFIMLVGGVGAGKSMFIERYMGHLIAPDIKENTLWVVINFNEAKSDLTDIETWICQQFAKVYGQQHSDTEPFSFENLNRYFSPDIARRKAGPYKLLSENDPSEYERRLTDDLVRWNDDPVKLTEGIIRYYSKDCGVPVVVVFDNVDRRDRDQQLAVFQAVQWFRHTNKCFSVLSLRDETFDAYKSEPPLDAFLKPFAFRITPPRFINVVKRRLELALNYLASNASKTQTFTLANGLTVTYPSDNIGRYLMTIYVAIFHPQRSIRLMLEALSGRNIRRALEMFTEILMSGYLTDERLFSLSEGSRRSIPEWLIIRVLMRTSYRYYAAEHGYIANVFDLQEDSKTSNNFLIIELLDYLVANRKQHTGFKLEGYFHVTQLIDVLSPCGYATEDVLWGLEKALNLGLIAADHQRDKGITVDDYVKVTAAGFYHLRFLTRRSEYLGNVVFDTFLSDTRAAKRVTEISTDRRHHLEERLSLFRTHLKSEQTRYGDAFPHYSKAESGTSKQLDRIEEAITFITTGRAAADGQSEMF